MINLSILELGERSNSNPRDSISDLIDYAIFSEQLGYNRFWLAEHHSNEISLPYTSPEILMTLIAENTKKIKVGSAGSLINYYSPYALVTKYKFLNNYFNNRIDFGLSKGHNIQLTKHDFLNLRTYNNDHYNFFEENIEKINSLLFEENENFREFGIVIPPYGGDIPSLWYLSSSYNHFETAIKFNLNYCRSLFHGYNLYDRDYEVDKLFEFRENFFKKNNREPEVLIAIGVWLDNNFNSIDYYRYKGMQVIKTNPQQLFELISSYYYKYNVNEFVLFDIAIDNRKKINNLECLSDIALFQ